MEYLIFHAAYSLIQAGVPIITSRLYSRLWWRNACYYKSCEKLVGDENSLTIVVTEQYSDGSVDTFEATILDDNNTAAIYQVSEYKVYVDVKGNTQIRECYIVK